MGDVASVIAFVGSIKTATEIVKAISGAGLTLEKAEYKFKLAELIEALADAKIHAAEIQEVIQEKDQRIKELENLLESKSKVVRHGEAYYEIDQNNNPKGSPFCSHCWEKNHQCIHLTRIGSYRVCPSCSHPVKSNRAPDISAAS